MVWPVVQNKIISVGTAGVNSLKIHNGGPIDQSTIDLIDLMLLERIPLAGIARVLSLSESSLQQYVNQLYEQLPQQVDVIPKKRGKLTV